MLCLRWGLNEATSYATSHSVQSPASGRAESKLAMPITRRNKEAGESVSSTVVHIRHLRDEQKNFSVLSQGIYFLAISITLSEFTSGVVY